MQETAPKPLYRFPHSPVPDSILHGLILRWVTMKSGFPHRTAFGHQLFPIEVNQVRNLIVKYKLAGENP
jgi:hypothetical protein